MSRWLSFQNWPFWEGESSQLNEWSTSESRKVAERGLKMQTWIRNVSGEEITLMKTRIQNTEFWGKRWSFPVRTDGSTCRGSHSWYRLNFFSFRLFRRDFPNRRARSYPLYRIDHSNRPAVTKYNVDVSVAIKPQDLLRWPCFSFWFNFRWHVFEGTETRLRESRNLRMTHSFAEIWAFSNALTIPREWRQKDKSIQNSMDAFMEM
jgi:hypothetical protein